MVPATPVNIAEFAPDATLTDAGTLSSGVLLDNATVAPPDPAACASVTVQFVTQPGFRVAGLHDRLLMDVGVSSEIEAVCELLLYDAVTAAVWAVVMVPAVAVKFADVAPDATVAVGGTVNAARLLESETVIPPVPAACESVTVHAAIPPALRLEGLHETRLTVVGATSSTEDVCMLPLYVAVTTAVWLVEIAPAVAVKPAELEPLDTVTDPGTLRAATLLFRVTAPPPAPAAVDSVTTQDEAPPEPSVAGVHTSDARAGGVETRVKDCV
jgi:hypothetical protein